MSKIVNCSDLNALSDLLQTASSPFNNLAYTLYRSGFFEQTGVCLRDIGMDSCGPGPTSCVLRGIEKVSSQLKYSELDLLHLDHVREMS